MKIILLIATVICFSLNGISQVIENENSGKNKLLKELADNGCKCIDSIDTYNKSKDELNFEIHRCIDNQAAAYQMGAKLMSVGDLAKNADENEGKKQINISINVNKNSQEYKDYYFEIERYLMNNCESLKSKIASNEKQSDKSFSKNQQAVELYSRGLDAAAKEDFSLAVDYYKKALKIDPEFAFAWDNMGLSYRKMGEYKKAIKAYKKSLEIDPEGLMPLQNIPIVYQYKKDYKKAITAYQKLAEVDKDNPEVFYGIGQVYTIGLKDYEKGLDNMCKAYNLYVEQKSPYRADAEKIIASIYTEMKKLGKEEKFNEILKLNNITPQ